MSLLYTRRRAWRACRLPLLALLALVASPAFAQTAFINELHYDDVDADNNEAVEIAVPMGTDVTTLDVTLYNGNGGVPYGSTLNGSTFTAGAMAGSYQLYSITLPTNGIQNGAPDGLALSQSGTLIQFLSYEGTFMGAGGPADGVMSTDIGVMEDNSTPDGQSLQLTGTGSSYDDFTWSGPVAATLGAVNQGQTFGSVGSSIVVTTSLDVVAMDGFCSLREAVQAANTNMAVNECAAGSDDGDTITFGATVLTAVTVNQGELDLTDDVTIDGSGLARVTIDAGGTSRIFDVDAASGAGSVTRVQFVSLILQNGDAGMGGSSAPNAGGAVDLKSGSAATFTDVDVTGSVAGVNGGGIHGAGNTDIVLTTTESGTSLISDNEARGNDAGMGGGGVWGAGTTTISGNVTIDGNRATGTSGSGGGALNFGGVMSISDATISNNTANRAGGGIEDFGDADDDTDLTLTDVTVTGNSITAPAPGNGGGLHSGGGEIVVTGGTFSGNAAIEGGGIWTSGTLTLTGTTITGNAGNGTAADDGGGGLFNNGGTMSLTNATITNNTATMGSGSGGGILNLGGTLTVTDGEISSNTSARAGGGIETAGGTVTIDGTGLASNDAGANPGNGGALHAGGSAEVEVTDAIVSMNTAVEGGGLWVSAAGTLTVSSSMVAQNEATGASADQGGGGLYSDGGTLAVIESEIRENEATGTSGSGGGLLAFGGTLVISGATISDNTAMRAGGGIELNGANPNAMGTEVLISETLFEGNDAGANPGNGGGIHAGGVSDMTLVEVEFVENTAVEGGGLWINAGGMLAALDSEFRGNEATGDAAEQGGGGFYNDGGEATFIGGEFAQNTATGTSGSGGGILNNAGRLAAAGTEFRENTANRAGGAIEERQATTPTDMTMLLSSVRMTANDAGANPGNGGGLHISGPGRVHVDSSMVDRNVAGSQGGGLWNSGAGVLRVTYTTVDRNQAPTGAGLYQQAGAEGLLVFENSTSSRNTASMVGGGLAADGAAVQITNSTVSANQATTSGGGIASRGARVLLSSATVASNEAASGGGLANLDVPDGNGGTMPGEPDAISPDNTIVADNTAASGADLLGAIMSRGYNLFETTSGATVTMDEGAAADITGVDPMLSALADNDGPTETQAIDPGSPAVNAGWTALMIDQRGVERRGTPDIGAFESDAPPTADEDFASEFADGEEYKWSRMAPNPFGATSTAQFAVRQAQSVRVVLYDVMGREVRVLHDGPLAASTAVDIQVDASGLASGVYVLVARGESLAATQRITVAR